MAGEDDGLLRFPLPPGFSDEPPAARITVNPVGTPAARDFTPYKGPEALGFGGPPAAAAAPAAAPAPPAASQSPLTALDPAMFPAAPAATPRPAPVLQPVDHDPFAQTLKPPPQSQLLIPVDFDPFSPNDMAALRTRMSVMAKGAPAGVDIAGRTKGFKNLDDALLGRNGQERFQTFPERWARAAAGEFGRAAEGQFPDTVYVPVGGRVSDEDLSRRFNDMNAGAEGASNFAMMGGPAQMVVRGLRGGPGRNVLSTGGAQPPGGKPRNPEGEGWFYNTKDRKTHSINEGDLGPNGDHDGWITVAENAERLGVDPRDAGAFQAATWGAYPDSTNPHVKAFAEKYPEQAHPMGNVVDEAAYDRDFKAHFGVDPNDALAASRLGNLVRVRRWPGKPGQGDMLAVMNVDNLKSPRSFVEDFVRDNPDALSNVRKVVVEADGGMKEMDVQEFLAAKWLKRGPGGGMVLGTAGAEDGKGRISVAPIVPAPPFYSAVEKTVQDSTLKSATPEQWLGTLKNAKGVKGEELDWLGLPDWLAEQKGPVSKQQVADYVASHKVELKEIRKYGDETDALHDAVMEKSYEVMDRWEANAEKLARGEGIQIALASDYNQRRPRTERWFEVKVDGTPIGRFNGKETAAKYAEEFKAEMAKPPEKRDLMDFAQEVMHPANYPEMQARHEVEGRVLSGGTEYREILLTLPQKEGPSLWHARAKPDGSGWQSYRADAPDDPRYTVNWPSREAAESDAFRANAATRENNKTREDFRVSGHWEEPNVLAWSRVNDRTIDGKKALFIEEVQSDWHQRGRESGYKQTEGKRTAAMAKAYNEWLAKEGLPAISADELAAHGPATESGDLVLSAKQQREARAWSAAFEADNPAVRDLWHKAYESRIARTEAFENAFRDTVRNGVPAETLRLLEQHGIELPTSMRGVTDLVGGEYITSAQANKIINAAQDRMDGPEIHAIADRAEADQRALEAAARQNLSGVPDAPLKKGWHEMVLKRMIREAAEHGYDKLAWTTGTQQNQRWSLSSHVNELQYDPATHRLFGITRAGRGIEETILPDKLPEYIGKEVAEKLLATRLQREDLGRGVAEYHHLEGLDLEVGGAGMKGFYDKMMVDAANKIAKPHGGKVTSGSIRTGSDTLSGERAMAAIGREARDELGIPHTPSAANTWWRNATQAKRDELMDRARMGTETVHTLDITPTLRDAAIGKGFPLFMGGVPVSRVQHDPFAEDERKKGPAAK